jgi:hypothetical protein
MTLHRVPGERQLVRNARNTSGKSVAGQDSQLVVGGLRTKEILERGELYMSCLV